MVPTDRPNWFSCEALRIKRTAYILPTFCVATFTPQSTNPEISCLKRLPGAEGPPEGRHVSPSRSYVNGGARRQVGILISPSTQLLMAALRFNIRLCNDEGARRERASRLMQARARMRAARLKAGGHAQSDARRRAARLGVAGRIHAHSHEWEECSRSPMNALARLCHALANRPVREPRSESLLI